MPKLHAVLALATALASASQAAFAQAFWNPQALPQILARTGGSLLLGALFFFLHATFKLGQNEPLRAKVGRESAKWAMIGSALTMIGGIGWYLNLPPSGLAALVGAAVLNVLMFIIFVLTGLTAVMMYYGPMRNPTWLNPGFAILLFCIGHAATGAGEFIRESVRLTGYPPTVREICAELKLSEVPVFLREHHEGYVSWAMYEENLSIIRQNLMRFPWQKDAVRMSIKAGIDCLMDRLRHDPG